MCPYCAKAFACAYDEKGNYMDDEYLIKTGVADVQKAMIMADLNIEYVSWENGSEGFALILSLLRDEDDTPEEELNYETYGCVPFVKKINYCPMCGQKLILDEVD